MRVQKIDKVSMAEGYLFMADINLQIAKEMFHLEDEGEKLYSEMDSEEA